MRILVFDIGNTQIKMGVYDQKELIASWRLTTSCDKTTDEYGVDIRMLLGYENIEAESIDYVAVSSVVPALMHSFVGAVRRYLHKEPLVVGPGIRTGIRIKTANPAEVGADLICDVAAGLEKYGAPLLIVDFGTVTKYEVINQDREFVYAVFSPGLGVSAKAMSDSAAQLPGIEIRKPKKILTSVTAECMQAGLVYGYIGQVEYIVDLIRKEMAMPDMKVVATGGFGRLFGNEIEQIDTYDSNLTLDGLRIIAERNIGRSGR